MVAIGNAADFRLIDSPALSAQTLSLPAGVAPSTIGVAVQLSTFRAKAFQPLFGPMSGRLKRKGWEFSR
jgi:hypothetical protein